MKKGLAMLMLAAVVGGTAVYAETGTSTASTTPAVCAQVITWAKSPTGEVKQFPNSCIPSGWTVIASVNVKIEDKIKKVEDSAQKKIQRLEQELARKIDSRPMMLEVGPKGKALLRGTIQSVSSSTSSTTGSIVVKTWGGNWTVVVYPDTEIVPKGNFPGGFQVGDYIGVRGQIDPDKTLTVDATVLRNWSRVVTIQTQKIEDKKKEEIKKLEDRLSNIKNERDGSVPANFVPTISADKARELALVALPGKTIVKVQLSNEEGKVVWKVQFSEDKRVDVDATTGAIVRIK